MFDVFKKVARGLFDEGLVSAFSGSLSIREGDKIFITAQNAMFSDLKEEDIIEASINDDSAGAASKELIAHRSIYQSSNAKAIVQATSPFAVALSINENKIMPQDAHGHRYLKSVPVVKVRDSIASREVAKMLPSIFKGGYSCAAIKGFGSFAAGADLIEAYRLTSTLERSCKIIYLNKKPQQHQHSRGWEDRKKQHSRGGIPPGIGVMDRTRYRKR